MRYKFGGGLDAYIFSPLAAPALGTNVTVPSLAAAVATCWTDRTGNTQYTDLLKADGTTAISTVATDANGLLPAEGFYCADGVLALWLGDANGNNRRFLPSMDLVSLIGTGGFSGAYADLTGKPTIPAAYTDKQAQDATAAAFAAGTQTGVTVVYDGANHKLSLTAAATPKFALQGNSPGPLTVGQVFPGGVRVDYPTTITGMVVWVDHESSGGDVHAQLVVRDRASGADTAVGTATIGSDVSRRGQLSGLSVAVNAGDRLFVQITQVGSAQPGSDLGVSILGPSAVISAALVAPGAPSRLSVTAARSDLTLAWTPPSSGVWSGVDLLRDGTFLARIPKGTNNFLDVAAAVDVHTYQVEAFNVDAVSGSSTASYSGSAGSGITDLGELGTNTAITGSTVTITVTKPVPVNGTVLVAAGAAGTTANTGSFTAVDSRGNVYTQDGFAIPASSSTNQVGVLSAPVTTALAVGDTITVTATNPGANVRLSAAARGLTSVQATGRADQEAGLGTQTASRTLTTGTTGALAQANEYAFAAFASLVSTPTAGNGWNLGSIVATAAGTSDRQLVTEWQVVASTAAVTGTLGLSSLSAYAAVAVTYKGV